MQSEKPLFIIAKLMIHEYSKDMQSEKPLFIIAKLMIHEYSNNMLYTSALPPN